MTETGRRPRAGGAARPRIDDRRWMRAALRAAEGAETAGEIPVGAVVVVGGVAIAEAGNASIATHDPTGHAEIRALRAAALAVGNYRWPPATILYVTVEPCAMCIGAALHARVARLVFGCRDPKGGAVGSVFDLSNDPRLNHRLTVMADVEAPACRALLRRFFRARRSGAVRATDAGA